MVIKRGDIFYADLRPVVGKGMNITAKYMESK